MSSFYSNKDMMGRVVTVDTQLIRQVNPIGENQLQYDGTAQVQWKKQNIKPRAGWVTGFRTLQNGVLHPAVGSNPSKMDIESTVKVMMVAFWPSMNPIPVPFGAFVFGGTPKSTAVKETYFPTLGVSAVLTSKKPYKASRVRASTRRRDTAPAYAFTMPLGSYSRY